MIVPGVGPDVRSPAGALAHWLWRPAAVVALVYALLLLWYAWHHGYGPIDFVHVGTVFSESDPEGGWGYDGQFYYYVAVAPDPWAAIPYLDNPTYRLRRIVYPLVARTAALGDPAAVPLAMLLVNVGAVVVATELLAGLLARSGVSRWYSLGYGVPFGQLASVAHQLADPLGSAFIVAGLWSIARGRIGWGAAAFGVAALTRDSLALVPLGYLVGYALRRRWRPTLCIAAFALLPLGLWTAALELAFRGAYDVGVTWTPIVEPVPLQGTLRVLRATPSYAATILLFLLPTWVVALVAARDAWRWWCARGTGSAAPPAAWWGWIAPAALLVMLAAEQVIDFLVPGRLAIGVSTTTAAYAACTRSTAARRLSTYFGSTGLLYPPMVFLEVSSVIP